MLDRGSVLVWEWQDEDHRWQPYSPQVAHYIEQVLRETPKASSVSLGEADASLTPYILDLISMNQFRLDTGTLYPVRRVNLPLSSAPGKGIVWEWEDLPGQWVSFEAKLSVLIQDALEKQQTGVRLGEPCNGSHICFQTMTKIELPSQRRTRVRARAHMPYPTAVVKRPTAQYHVALPQYLNGNSDYKHAFFSVHPQPMRSNHGLMNFNQEQINSSNGQMKCRRRTLSSNQEAASFNEGLVNMNHGLVNLNQGLPNFNQGRINTNHLLVTHNHVPMKIHHRTINSRQEPLHTNYGIIDPSLMLQNSNYELVNGNQGSINFNSGAVNYTRGPEHSNRCHSNDRLVNYSQEQDDANQELINFDANVILPNYGPSSYCESSSDDSSSSSGSPNSMLLDSDISPHFEPVNHDCNVFNSSPALASATPRRPASRPGLSRSESRCRDSRPELTRSESRPGDFRPALSRANSRREEHQAVLHRSESKPAGNRPEFLRSNSGPNEYKPEFVRSHSRPGVSTPKLIRCESKYGFSACDSRPAEFRPSLGRSESRHDTRSAVVSTDCRSMCTRPGFSRSNSRPEDNRTELLSSHSRSNDSKSVLASPHHGISHVKPRLASRSLSRSDSLRRGRSPPPCACPHCLLVQSVKSASWPGRQSDTRAATVQCRESQRYEKSRSLPRVPPVPLSNIEGSGMIPPALAGISGLLMSAAGLPVCLSIPAAPVFRPPAVKKRDLRPVPGIQGNSRKISNKKSKKPEEMIKQFLQRVKTSLSEDCALCGEEMTNGEVGRLYRCSHTYHVRCLASLYKDGTLRCPTCHTLYGTKIGSQPPGKMSFHLIPHSLPGYPDCDTIRIIYHIPPGIQGSGQPHPGMKFTASDFPLHCYLPNTKKGREVLLLLIKAWECRLLFPVVPSKVSGVSDSISISRIPLKTEFGSNVTGKGFPDSHYLDSVLRQLRDWGVSGD
ncbi:E3 ubiquitin-protein ligase DTX4-like [Hyperolius riggenbachi]|uniref:E3 ubiquitin-protein ligase DTX4-like n=1 Tax=Hyperolius riggenbachi TaxID=752182 RepID=UPI0035A31D32